MTGFAKSGKHRSSKLPGICFRDAALSKSKLQTAALEHSRCPSVPRARRAGTFPRTALSNHLQSLGWHRPLPFRFSDRKCVCHFNGYVKTLAGCVSYCREGKTVSLPWMIQEATHVPQCFTPSICNVSKTGGDFLEPRRHRLMSSFLRFYSSW